MKKVLCFASALSHVFLFHFLLAASSVNENPYPLGGTWRAGLPESYRDVHSQMVRLEAENSHQADKDVGNFGSNLALSRLRIYVESASAAASAVSPLKGIDLIDGLPGKLFVSGGHIIQDYATLEFRQIVQERLELDALLKKERECLAKILTGMPKDGDPKSNDPKGGVQDVLQQIEDVSKKYSTEYEEKMRLYKEKAKVVNELERSHEEQCACKDEGYKKYIYDSEQIIIGVVNHYISEFTKPSSGANFSTRNGEIPKTSVKRIVLHVHSRFDMCLYCLKSFHQKNKHWNSLLKSRGLPNLLILVSSRQDFLPKSTYLYTLPGVRYMGTSMRSIGIDVDSAGELTEEQARDFASEGIIVQIVIPYTEVFRHSRDS